MKYITAELEAYRYISALESYDIWYMDTEGTSLDPYDNRLLLVQIRAGDEVYVFDMVQLPEKVLNAFKRAWVSASILKVFQNAKYDIKVLYHCFKVLPVRIHDTLVAERLIWAGINPGGFGLDDIAKRRLNLELDKTIRKSFTTTDGIFTQEQLDYAAQDVQVLPEIYRQQMQELEEKKLLQVYDVEMQLTPVVALMEYTGMPFERDHMSALEPEFARIIREAHQALQDLFIGAGVIDTIVFTEDGYYGFNPNSAKYQVVPLMNAVGINIPDMNAKTIVQWDFKNRKKAHRYDVDFTELFDDDDLATTIETYGTLENDYLRAFMYYVAVNKLMTTYIQGLPELVNKSTGRIHTNFNQLGARTGRFSSSKPNLQNLAKDSKLSALGITGSIRQGFKCGPYTKLIIADYSGIELVIIADASEDEGLIELVRLDEVHEAVTRDVLGWKEITKANKKEKPHKYWRDASKKLSYSIAYGVQGKNLSESLTLELAPIGVKFSPDEADKLIAGWKNRFSAAGSWLDKNARSVVNYGYVVDGVGRKRFWDVETFHDKWKLLAAQREAANFPVQSLSAHMTKLALIHTHNGLDLSRARIVSTVHDEIIVESAKSYAEQAAQVLKDGMERAARSVLKRLGDFVVVEPAISDKYDK